MICLCPIEIELSSLLIQSCPSDWDLLWIPPHSPHHVTWLSPIHPPGLISAISPSLRSLLFPRTESPCIILCSSTGQPEQWPTMSTTAFGRRRMSLKAGPQAQGRHGMGRRSQWVFTNRLNELGNTVSPLMALVNLEGLCRMKLLYRWDLQGPYWRLKGPLENSFLMPTTNSENRHLSRKPSGTFLGLTIVSNKNMTKFWSLREEIYLRIWERCSKAFLVREIQVKTTMRYLFKLTRIANK